MIDPDETQLLLKMARENGAQIKRRGDYRIAKPLIDFGTDQEGRAVLDDRSRKRAASVGERVRGFRERQR